MVQVDNINDVDILRNMYDDPILNSNSKKSRSDIVFINSDINLINEHQYFGDINENETK